MERKFLMRLENLTGEERVPHYVLYQHLDNVLFAHKHSSLEDLGHGFGYEFIHSHDIRLSYTPDFDLVTLNGHLYRVRGLTDEEIKIFENYAQLAAKHKLQEEYEKS